MITPNRPTLGAASEEGRDTMIGFARPLSVLSKGMHVVRLSFWFRVVLVHGALYISLFLRFVVLCQLLPLLLPL